MVLTNLYKPAIVNLPSGRYVVCNEGWIPVSEDYTMDNVRLDWKPVIYNTPVKPIDKVFKVSSKSDLNKTYTVTVENGGYHCTCTGFGYRRKCCHVEEIKSELK